MEFVKKVREARFINPGPDGEPVAHAIEYRRDPLTGVVARINAARAERVRQAQIAAVDLSDVIARTRTNCMFCPENVERATPRFTPDIAPSGRIARGETLIFPNLYPFAERHAVGVLTLAHYLELDRFTPEMLTDNLLGAQEYFRAVYRSTPALRYPLWIWNFLPPSAASVVHPHTQLLVDRTPSDGLRQVLVASQRYIRRHGTNYWRDLVQTERAQGERMIFDGDELAVLASFAPRGGRDVQIVIKNVSNVIDLSERQVAVLARAIVTVLRGYKAAGVNSFNVVTYSAAVRERLDHFWLTARVISRPRFQAYYTGDCGFMERFFGEFVIETRPEDVAESLSPYFASDLIW